MYIHLYMFFKATLQTTLCNSNTLYLTATHCSTCTATTHPGHLARDQGDPSDHVVMAQFRIAPGRGGGEER